MTTEDLAKLTPEEKSIRIAELCGWQPYNGVQTIAYMWAPGHISNVVPKWTRTINDEVDFRIELPDYLNDLNAAIALADHAAKQGWTVRIDNGLDTTWECTFETGTSGHKNFRQHYAAAATLSQAICDAFILTLG